MKNTLRPFKSIKRKSKRKINYLIVLKNLFKQLFVLIVLFGLVSVIVFFIGFCFKILFYLFLIGWNWF
jgi:hypothetical protein